MAMRFTVGEKEYELVDFDALTLRESFEVQQAVGEAQGTRHVLAALCWISMRQVDHDVTWEWFQDNITVADLKRVEAEIEASSDDEAADGDDAEDDAGPPLRAVSAAGGSRGTSASTASSRGGSRTSRSKS